MRVLSRVKAVWSDEKASPLDKASDQRHAPAALYHRRKYPRCPLDRKVGGWAPELVWTRRLEENSLAFAGDRTQVVQYVIDTTLTELPLILSV
jgi:hypothetical protein